MKRRDFIVSGIAALIGLAGFVGQALAEVVWAKKGVSGYMEKASPQRAVKKETCVTCKHFKDNKKVADGGLCTFTGISKGEEVFVKKEGVCSMWYKKS